MKFTANFIKTLVKLPINSRGAILSIQNPYSYPSEEEKQRNFFLHTVSQGRIEQYKHRHNNPNLSEQRVFQEILFKRQLYLLDGSGGGGRKDGVFTYTLNVDPERTNSLIEKLSSYFTSPQTKGVIIFDTEVTSRFAMSNGNVAYISDTDLNFHPIVSKDMNGKYCIHDRALWNQIDGAAMMEIEDIRTQLNTICHALSIPEDLSAIEKLKIIYDKFPNGEKNSGLYNRAIKDLELLTQTINSVKEVNSFGATASISAQEENSTMNVSLSQNRKI